MFQVGQRVSGPHGLGTIVNLNRTSSNAYFTERPLEAARIAANLGMEGALTNSVYSGDRYPYVVRFDTGYEDVYAEGELEAA